MRCCSGEHTTTLEAADNDLNMWRAHLDQTNARNTVIESQLTKFMLIHICGHYEMEIVEIVSRRVQKSGDEGVAAYVTSQLERRTPIHPDSLKSILKGFGGECLDKFREGAKRDDLLHYRIIVENRNKSAHGRYVHVTFDEVREHHAGAKRVIDAFGRALDS